MGAQYSVYGTLIVNKSEALDELIAQANDALGDWVTLTDCNDGTTEICLNIGDSFGYGLLNKIDECVDAFRAHVVAPGWLWTQYENDDREIVYMGPAALRAAAESDNAFQEIQKRLPTLTPDDTLKLIDALLARTLAETRDKEAG